MGEGEEGKEGLDARSSPRRVSFRTPDWPWLAMSAIQILLILKPLVFERA